MTVLFGDTEFTSYSGVGPSDADGGYIAGSPFVALSGGQVTSLYAYLSPTGTPSFVMALYDPTGQLITYSAPIQVTTAGLIRFPVPAAPICALQSYQILLIPIAPAIFQFGVDTSLFSSAFRVPNANATPTELGFQLGPKQPTQFGPPVFFADGDVQAQTIAPSGKIGEHTIDTATVISRAFNRAKIRSSIISDEMIQIAKDELFMFLTGDMALRGTQLFSVDIQLLPFTAGLAGVPMPAGTIDVLNANYRLLTPFQASPSTGFSPSAGGPVTTVAITWAGPAVPILIQQSQDNLTWQTIVTANPNASAGQTSFYDLDGSLPGSYWQVIANPLPPGNATNQLMVSNVTFFGTLSQVPMAPYSRDDYSYLSNTFFTGRPFQFWLDRQEPWPIMRLWPTPSLQDQQHGCIVLWRKRQIMDIGELSQRINIPNRWLTAVIDNLAFRLGKTIREVDPNLLPMLKAEAQESFNLARSEERENATMRIQPSIYMYTR